MRAQFFDGFDFATFKLSIVAIEKVDDFFNIEDFGLHPIMYNEACLRGYTAVFGFNDEKNADPSQALDQQQRHGAPGYRRRSA